MAVETTLWHQQNEGKYLRLKQGRTEVVIIDLTNQIPTTDYLTGLSIDTPTGLTIETGVRDAVNTSNQQPKQQYMIITAGTVGIYNIKAISNTIENRTIVKHFQVRVEE